MRNSGAMVRLKTDVSLLCRRVKGEGAHGGGMLISERRCLSPIFVVSSSNLSSSSSSSFLSDVFDRFRTDDTSFWTTSGDEECILSKIAFYNAKL